MFLKARMSIIRFLARNAIINTWVREKRINSRRNPITICSSISAVFKNDVIPINESRNKSG